MWLVKTMNALVKAQERTINNVLAQYKSQGTIEDLKTLLKSGGAIMVNVNGTRCTLLYRMNADYTHEELENGDIVEVK